MTVSSGPSSSSRPRASFAPPVPPASRTTGATGAARLLRCARRMRLARPHDAAPGRARGAPGRGAHRGRAGRGGARRSGARAGRRLERRDRRRGRARARSCCVRTRGVERDGEPLVVAGGRAVGRARRALRRATGLQGFECLSGIPGSTGATPIQNVGAYGQDVVRDGRVGARLRPRDRRASRRWTPPRAASTTAAACSSTATAGRCSRSRSGCARPSSPARCATPSWRARSTCRSAARAPLAEVRAAVLGLRRGKGMVIDPADPDSVSAGSFFTNPILSARGVGARSAATRPRFPEPDGRIKTSAAWLIERAGLRARVRGRTRRHLDQAHARAGQPRRARRRPS